MKVGTPRAGSELEYDVFKRWQEQVNRALRSLQISGIVLATNIIDFPEIAAQDQETSAETVTGARAGAAVFVSTVAAPPSGVVLDGFVSDTDEVTVRASNLTGSPINPGSASYVIVCLNLPET